MGFHSDRNNFSLETAFLCRMYNDFYRIYHGLLGWGPIIELDFSMVMS